MKLKTITRIALALFLASALSITFSPTSTIANPANLIKNGDFEAGLENWQQKTGGVGNFSIDTVSDEEIGSNVLDFKRWNSGNDGGSVYAYQPLEIDLSEHSPLYLEVDVKVISNTLKDSGWWSYTHGGIGELPVHILIAYQDGNGKSWLWTHGFLPTPDPWGRTNVDVVALNQWYHYASPNLLEMVTTQTKPGNEPISSPPPVKIIGIYLGGNGWDFHGRIDNAKLSESYDRASDKYNTITAEIDFDPDTLNLKSKGKWVTGYIEFPLGKDVAEIDISTIGLWPVSKCYYKVQPPFYPELYPTEIGDYDNDGNADLMIKFDRSLLIKWLESVPASERGPEVTLNINGWLKSYAEPFNGYDMMRVIWD